MPRRVELLLALAGLILGAIGFQFGWKGVEFAGLITAAVAFGILLADRGRAL